MPRSRRIQHTAGEPTFRTIYRSYQWHCYVFAREILAPTNKFVFAKRSSVLLLFIFTIRYAVQLITDPAQRGNDVKNDVKNSKSAEPCAERVKVNGTRVHLASARPVASMA